MTATQAPPTLSSADVCRQTGLTYRTLDNWVRRGYLKPEQHVPPPPRHWEGSGYPRQWPPDELDRARMMARLVSLGVNAQHAAILARDPHERHNWLRDVFVACRAMEP